MGNLEKQLNELDGKQVVVFWSCGFIKGKLDQYDNNWRIQPLEGTIFCNFFFHTHDIETIIENRIYI